MMDEVESIIHKVHAAPHKVVVVVAGAGNQAMAWLLGVPGASRTVLEALVPYGRLSMMDFLGYEPEQYVSVETARAMARAAYYRALALREDGAPVVGLACTATIATDRPKRGDHRCCIALWDEQGVTTYNLRLDKGRRDRAGEEEVVSRLVINALARHCGIGDELNPGFTEAERVAVEAVEHPHPVRRLLAGQCNTVTVYPDGRKVVDEPLRAAVLPGSFSPLHQGHRQLAQVVSEITGKEAVFELSVVNVDKPPLAEEEVDKRLAQFHEVGKVALTRAETFHKKARLFPGSTFVIGWDTAVRLVDPKYYGGDYAAMCQALAEMWALGCHFLVAGREQDGHFRTLAEAPIPQGFGGLFQEIPESRFRVDVSSTMIRNNGG